MKKRRSVHLVGSIPLTKSADVFDLVGKYLRNSCQRVPDGETGVRLNWIGWQKNIFAQQPALVQCKFKERDYQLNAPYAVSKGKSTKDIEFGILGFAEEAILSHKIFSQKQDAGILSPKSKFLISIPTAFAPVYSFISYEFQEVIYPLYEEAIINEVKYIFERLDPETVAIQWDVATEMSIFEKVYKATFDNEWDILISRLAKLGETIPAQAELGYHLCYGSMNNQHWKEPEDLSTCIRTLNELKAQIDRKINFIHVPVPINRKDEEYFKPLTKWETEENQDFFLGLIHEEDGVAGNLARIGTASKYLEHFGISTECGMGRRLPEVIPRWMELMANLSENT